MNARRPRRNSGNVSVQALSLCEKEAINDFLSSFNFPSLVGLTAVDAGNFIALK